MHVERKQLSYHALKLSFQVLKCTRVMYFPCQFAAVTDMSPNPISGYFPLKCCKELLNMFYKLAPQKKHYPALFRDKASQQQKTHRMTWTDEKTEKAQHSLPVKVLEQMNKIPPPAEMPTELLHTWLRASESTALTLHTMPWCLLSCYTHLSTAWKSLLPAWHCSCSLQPDFKALLPLWLSKGAEGLAPMPAVRFLGT